MPRKLTDNNAMEYIDLYGADRQPLGQTILRGQTLPPDTYRLVVHVCLFNTQGEMLIQQRHTHKSIFPDLWDLSAGGQVSHGETSSVAAMRETAEELGLHLPIADMRPKLTIHFEDGFDDIYLLSTDITINDLRLQQEEVHAVRFADEDTILRMIQEGRFIPYHEAYIRLLFTMRTKTGSFFN